VQLLTRIENDLAVVVNGKQLENVRCTKLLRLEIDQELTFIPHIDKLCKRSIAENRLFEEDQTLLTT